MGTPVFTVELGLASTSTSFTLDSATEGILNTGTLGDDLGYVWTNVSTYVLDEGFTFRRGATRSQGPWWRYEAGSASFTVDNLDGRFDPLNLSGPYVSGGLSELRPGLPVRIAAVINGTTETQWLGVVDHLELDYNSMTWSTVQFVCVDGLERLQAAELPPLAEAVGAGDTVPARLNRILDRADWPGDRFFDETPATTLQASTLAGTAWSQVLNAVDSDAGYVWITKTGGMQFLSRGAIATTPALTFTSTADGTGLDFDQVIISNDVAQVYNAVTLQRAEGLPVFVEDINAQAIIGQIRGYSRTDLLCETDAQVADIASWVLALYADMTTRVEELTIRPPADDTLLSPSSWWSLMRLEIGTVVRVIHATPDGRSITVDGVIRGVEWSAGVRSFSLKLSLQTNADDVGQFRLNDTVDGVLDSASLAASQPYRPSTRPVSLVA